MKNYAFLFFVFVFLFPLFLSATEQSRPLIGAKQIDPEIVQDLTDTMGGVMTQLMIIQIPLQMLSGNAASANQSIAQAQNQINAMAEKNPNSAYAYLLQCMLYKFQNDVDGTPYCNQALVIVNDKLQRHPKEVTYYSIKSSIYLFLGDEKQAEQTLLTAKKQIDPTDKNGMDSLDDALRKLREKSTKKTSEDKNKK